MKKIISTFLIIVILIIAGGGGLYLFYKDQVENPFTNPKDPVTVSVSENEALYEVLPRLEKEGIIRSANVAKVYFRLMGGDLDIKPGKYTVKAGGNLDDLLKALQGSNENTITVTIPEGFNIEQMAVRFEEAGLFKKDEFISAVKSYEIPKYINKDSNRRYALEGFLYPDTYTFSKGVEPTAVINEMSKSFEAAMKKKSEQLGINTNENSWDEIVTKAAMIEKETNVPEEREIVASVIENRLKEKMKLQIDATILYAVNDQHKEITMDDILMENPYNTYYVDGLPQGPICSPSLESIEAVLKPASTDYIFYVLNPRTGKHFFTKDYDEFEVKRKEFIGYTTVPVASNTTKINGPGLVTKPKTIPYEDTKGYTSNTSKTDDGKLKFPKLTVPEDFFKSNR